VNPDLISDTARALALPRLKQAAGLLTRWLPIPQPTMLVGPGASARLGQALAGLGHRRLLVVTDADIVRLGLLQPLTDALQAGGLPWQVFDGVTADAPQPVVLAGVQAFEAGPCDAIVAVGGGSVMDAAKVIGLAWANDRHPRDLVGYFRGRRSPPPLYAVPTTAGTGSEVTVAAVVSDPDTQRKLVVADTRLVPRMAALDPALMTGLPPHITAATGMDALTHAVEAYIGGWNTAFTRRMALAATGLVYRHLPVACEDGANLAAREQMALAATYAGLAFTRANVGNVHALAHQLGARYHTPHGLANALLLPGVLRWSLPAAEAPLAELAVRAGVARSGTSAARRALRFVESVMQLNQRLGIPAHLPALREEDIPALAAAACREADFNYPVPRRMTQADAEDLLRGLLPAPAPAPAPRRKTAKAARAAAPSSRPRRAAPL
jgi:alcohol dehydrogenase class IV